MSAPASPSHPTPAFALVAFAAALAVPPLVFLVAGSAAGMSPGAVLTAFVEQCAQRRQNPLITGLAGWIPVALLLLSLRLTRRSGPAASHAMARGGLLAILAVIAWANFEFWPKFLPSRMYPGFPHGLELVIGPLLFAPAAMVLGMLAGRGFARRDSS